MSTADHLLYAVLWLSFGVGHSLLAGDALKRLFGTAYRLAYNATALVHLVAVFLAGRIWLAPGGLVFDRPGWLQVVQGAIAGGGVITLVLALRGYDLSLFSGTAQLRAARTGNAKDDADEPLRCDGLNHYVRHPLYAGALAVVWGIADSEFAVATAVWVSVYFWLGSIVEERRLIARYGDVYRDYRARVPAFVPWKGRAR